VLLAARARSRVPWWFVIASATVLGWALTNGAVFFQHRVVDESHRQDLLCFDNAAHENKDKSKDAGVPVGNGVYETRVDNPCGNGDLLVDSYIPFMGLLYGPLYLLCCSLFYWLIVVRRASRGQTRQVVLLAVAVLVIEWAAIVGECTAVFGERSRPVYFDQMCNRVDLYISLPLTIAAGFLTSWIVTTQVLQRFGRRD